MWSQICGNIAYLATQLLETKTKKKYTHKKNKKKINNLWWILGGKKYYYLDLKTVFPKLNFFLLF